MDNRDYNGTVIIGYWSTFVKIVDARIFFLTLSYVVHTKLSEVLHKFGSRSQANR